MYNYLIKIIPTTLKFIPVYILLKINVTPLNLAFAKRSQIVVKALDHSPGLPRNASKYRDNRPFYTLVSEFCRGIQIIS